MKIRWNTGRGYTKDGQIIEAILEGNRVTFQDFSRGIDGEFTVTRPELITTPDLLKSVVMTKYDRNTYHSICLSNG